MPLECAARRRSEGPCRVVTEAVLDPETGTGTVIGTGRALGQALSELEHASTRDAVTGLHNRHCFEELIGHALGRAARHGRSLALLLIDVDDFKTLNDALGHPFGDDVLRAVADAMRECVRQGDEVACIGGDEFAVVLAEAEEAEALVVAHKLLETVRALGLCGREGLSCGVSVSIGLAVYLEHALSVAALVEYADQGLRLAKRRGKSGNGVGWLMTGGRA